MDDDEGFQGIARTGCVIIIAIVLLVTFARMVIDGRREHQADIAAKRSQNADMVKSCRIEQNRSDGDALRECQNAAAVFGQDISGNGARLDACLQVREDELKYCEKNNIH